MTNRYFSRLFARVIRIGIGPQRVDRGKLSLPQKTRDACADLLWLSLHPTHKSLQHFTLGWRSILRDLVLLQLSVRHFISPGTQHSVVRKTDAIGTQYHPAA